MRRRGIISIQQPGLQNMQLHGELGAQTDRDQAAVSMPSKRKPAKTRKVTVRLSEALHERFQLAAEHPGAGKSMMVENALDRLLSQATPVEGLVGERFDEMRDRFDHLERDIRIMAETVALHARYHLALMPIVPESRQQEAILLGDERFKVLAEQVDFRVQMGQPLLQETIERLKSEDRGAVPRTSEKQPPDRGRGHANRKPACEGADAHQSPPGASKGTICACNAATLDAIGEDRNRPDNPEWSRETERASFADEAYKSGASQSRPLSKWHLTFSIFLPFVAGYFLSFLFRTISGSISPALATEFGLDAAQTGLLASVYFLVFAGAQIPVGILLDRYGPRRVHSVLLILAVGGATLFGSADGLIELLIGRALIGLGVSAALMAGLKAIVTWFPKERIAFMNGCMIMLGSLGAVAATAPTDWLLNWIGWRSLFEILTVATLATSAMVYFFVPKDDENPEIFGKSNSLPKLRAILTDPRFLRMAPLSATCIGSSWAMQSLWAASWLADVERLDRPSLVHQIFAMAIAVSIGALLLGTIADRLRRRGVTTEALLGALGGLFILAEFALILRLPLPSIVPWLTVSLMGAATVLSFAMIGEYFPKGAVARANGALNLFHFGWAFIVQYGIGLVVQQWPAQEGHYPTAAYQTAFGIVLALQILALGWFVVTWLRSIDTSGGYRGSDDREACGSPAAPPSRAVAGAYTIDGPW